MKGGENETKKQKGARRREPPKCRRDKKRRGRNVGSRRGERNQEIHSARRETRNEKRQRPPFGARPIRTATIRREGCAVPGWFTEGTREKKSPAAAPADTAGRSHFLFLHPQQTGRAYGSIEGGKGEREASSAPFGRTRALRRLLPSTPLRARGKK